ncbi:uncharacterized protein LOC144643511 isoform X1 [Oculina patagonica]
MSSAPIALYFTVFVCTGCIVGSSLATSHQLRATFSMSGIKGDVIFSEPHGNGPKSIMVNLTGINEALTWSIHQLPMMYNGNAAMSCSASAVGALFDPMMAMKSEDYNSTCRLSNETRFEACAIGDLTGLFGSLDANTTQQNYTSPNLMIPIKGPYSIMGRTLVLYSGNTTKACALITPTQPMLTAVAYFKAPVAGSVYLRQVDESSDTTVFANLFFSNDAESQKQFQWQIQASAACDNLGEIFNPDNTEGQNCSQKRQDNCSIGDLTSKHGNITVSMATMSQSKTKAAFTDTNLPLSGANSVIGKSIVLFSSSDPQTPFACAKIMEVKPKILKSSFKPSVHDGVSGYFKITQRSPFDPSITEIDVTGLKKESQGYHVHNYPMPWQMHYTGSESCAGGNLGGHWNPFGVDVKSSPAPGSGTNDEYEIGDLSGKYGTFLNLSSYRGKHYDYNLPLFGKNSIQGRSIVIHKMKMMGSGRWVCADVHQVADGDNMFVMKTKITFTGPTLKGYMLLVQYKSHDKFMTSEETSIYVDLAYSSNSSIKSVDHNWHVHVNPEGNDTYAEMGARCKSLGGHYNPYHVDLAGTYKSTCFSSNMLRCEVGDLSGKHAMLSVGSGKEFYTDPDLPLFGEMSVVGRGIVVHAENAGGARLACATIKPVASLYVEKTLQYVEGAGFSRMNFAKTVSAALNIPDWRLFYIRTKDSNVKGCITVKFAIIGNQKQVSEPSQAFDLILQRTPGKLKEFQPRSKCRAPASTTATTRVRTGSAGTNHVNTYVILNMVLLTVYAYLG